MDDVTGPTNPLPDDALRVGHAEREQVVELLGESMAGGYLDLAEFEHRVAIAHAATTRGELRALLADLPAANALYQPGSALPGGRQAPPPTSPAPTPAASGWQPVEEVELEGSMENTLSRRGVWTVPPRIMLTGSMATFKLDFSQAQLPPVGVDIDVQASWSTVRLWIGPTMQLSTDQFATSMWTTMKDKTGPTPATRGVVINVRGKPSMTTVVVRRTKK